MKRKNTFNGYVIISMLVIISIMLVLTYFLADMLFSELAIARNQKAATVSFNLAEAGISEAYFRLQNDAGTQDKFLHSVDGQTNFSHDPALLTGGSYEVNITNTALATATITATGFYDFGLKTAQRKVAVNVTKATAPPIFDQDGAIFTAGSTGDEDITLSAATLNVTNGGSLLSSRDIWSSLSSVNIAKEIFANREMRLTLSTVNAGTDVTAHEDLHITLSSVTAPGTISGNMPARTFTMPEINNVTSDDPDSYKSKAIASGQYFTAKEFDDLMHTVHDVNLSGITYVAGGINIESSKWSEPAPTVTINGVLVTEGSVDVGKPLKKGTLTINHIEGQPSGLITLGKLTAWAFSDVDLTGLVYIGDRFSFDPFYGVGTQDINIRGGILCRRFEGRGLRTINIIFDKDLINEALNDTSTETPIIQTQHWEEEY